MNQVSLFIVMLHSSLYFKYLLSNYSTMTYLMTRFPQVLTKNNTHVVGATSMLQTLLIASIEVSLLFQLRVILLTEKVGLIGNILFAFCSIFGAATIGMYFAMCVKTILAYYNGVHIVDPIYFNVATILFASSINLMTVILVIKLVFAVRARRYLGLKQFDAFHMLLIVSCHSLLAPSIIYIIAYSNSQSVSFSSLVAIANLLVVLSLPLSSMWASVANTASNTTSMYYINTSNKNFADDSSLKTFGDDTTLATSTFKSKLYCFSPRRNRESYDDDLEKTMTSSTVMGQVEYLSNHEIYEIDTSSGNSASPYSVNSQSFTFEDQAKWNNSQPNEIVTSNSNGTIE